MRGWTVVALLLVSCGGAPLASRHVITTLPSDEEAAAYACRPGLVAIEVDGTRRRPEPMPTRVNVRLSDGQLGTRQVLVGDDPPVRFGVDVTLLYSETLIDESGAVLTTFEERGERGKSVAIVVDGRVVHAGGIRLVDDPLRLTEREGGWLFTYLSRGDDTLVVRSIDLDGTEHEVARVRGDTEYSPQGIATESQGVVSIAYATDHSVRFLRTPSEPPIEVDRDPSALSIQPVALLAVDDGWWLVTELSWQSEHYSARPPEWRFVHLNPSGEPTTRTIARGLGGSFGGSLRVEGRRPVARFFARGGEQFDVVVEERGACERAFGPCDPRAWPGPRTRAADPSRIASAASSNADCSAMEGNALIVGVIDSNGLSLRDSEGRRLHTFRGHWLECGLVPLASHTILVGTRWNEESAPVPRPMVDAFVLSDRGRTIAHHASRRSGGALLATRLEDGAVFAWSSASAEVVWEFDAVGRPQGPPRDLVTFYDPTRGALEQTRYGPALVWSTGEEHGVVPLCHEPSSTD